MDSQCLYLNRTLYVSLYERRCIDIYRSLRMKSLYYSLTETYTIVGRNMRRWL